MVSGTKRSPAGRSNRWSPATWAAFISVAVLICVLYSGYKRLMWDDEFFHFAFAAVVDPLDALRLIQKQTGEIFFGRTGVYAAVDYFLLRLGGANLILLRLPSTVSALWMFVAVLFFLNKRGYSWIAGAVFLAMAVGQSSLMGYAGDASSYMPLAAATVGTFCYYLLPIGQRNEPSVAILGWVSVLWGVLMHPYFLLYWPAAISFGLLWFGRLNQTELRGNLKCFLNLRLLFVGSVIAGILGLFTWLQRTERHSLDPFLHTRERGGLSSTLLHEHLYFLPQPQAIALPTIAIVSSLLLLGFAAGKSKNLARDVLPPLSLVAFALALSLSITIISIQREYWVLPRQWVASQALVLLGFSWLVGVFLSRCATEKMHRLSVVAAFMLLALFSLVSFNRATAQVEALRWDISRYNEMQQSLRLAAPDPSLITAVGNKYWLIIANNNVLMGGDVLPELAAYYGY